MNVLIEPPSSLELPLPFLSNIHSSSGTGGSVNNQKLNRKSDKKVNKSSENTDEGVTVEHAENKEEDDSQQINEDGEDEEDEEEDENTTNTQNQADTDAVNSASTTAMLLDQVIRAIHAAFPHLNPHTNSHTDVKEVGEVGEANENNINNEKHDFQSEKDREEVAPSSTDPVPSSISVLKSTADSGIDRTVMDHLRIPVPIRIMSPTTLGTAAFAPYCLSNSSLEQLKNALHVDITVNNSENGEISRISRDFSLLQYYALLNLYSDSPEVLAVIKQHSPAIKDRSTEEYSSTGLSSTEYSRGLEELQNGATGLSLSVHPTVAYVLQLKSIIMRDENAIQGDHQTFSLLILIVQHFFNWFFVVFIGRYLFLFLVF